MRTTIITRTVSKSVGDGRTEESQAQPSDLLAETVFRKRTAPKTSPGWTHFGVENLAPKVEALIKRNVFAAPFWGPKFEPQNGVRPTYFFSHFFGVSACLQRFQTWPSMLVETLARYLFDDAPSEATCAPSSQRAQFARVWLAAAIRVMAEQKNHRHSQTSMNPSDLLAETVFGKRVDFRKHHSVGWTPFWGPNLVPKWRLSKEEMCSRPPFWGPNFGPQNGVRPTYFFSIFGVSACVFNALRRNQAC